MRLKLEYKIALLVLANCQPMNVTAIAFQGEITHGFP